jgi:pimeloyl-ACP methyl ester carboxylesterase
VHDTSAYRSPAGRNDVAVWCDERLRTWSPAHRRREVPTAAGPTHVLEVGQGRPTVVYLAGTNENAATSLSLLALLAAAGRVLAIDLPGQPGLSSSRRPRAHRLPWYGRWLSEVLAVTDSSGAVVVGHSLGAAVALSCDSDRIAARVLVSPGGLVRLRLPATMLTSSLSWMLRPSRAHSAAMLAGMSAPGTAVADERIEWYTLVARTCRPSLAPAVVPDRVLAVARRGPCVVATGHADPFLPPSRVLPAARRRLGAAAEVIAAAGHLVPDEQPGAIAALVARVASHLTAGSSSP